jgi:putative chitinase
VQLTEEQVRKCLPGFRWPAVLTRHLNLHLPKSGIDSARELAEFLAQCGHESLDFTRLEENLDYSADALRRMWPRRFQTDESAAAYARRPEMIANKVYADRMGNGPEAGGDGWRFHGRGAIQLTGHDNYAAFAAARGLRFDPEAIAGYLTTIPGAIDSACWFWTAHGLNALSEAGNVEAVTRVINGGLTGIEDRRARYARCLKALGGT